MELHNVYEAVHVHVQTFNREGLKDTGNIV